jgi:hypothetical protein
MSPNTLKYQGKNHQKQALRIGNNMLIRTSLTKYLPIYFAILIVASCAKISESKRSIKNLKNIQITETGSEEKDAFCEAFKLNEHQVAVYFSEADEITSKVIHDEYDWLPCFVRGTLTSDDSVYRWEIRAGGTAELTSIKTGEVTWYGCKKCNGLFAD